MKDYQDQKICILGMGYVGLTLAVVMAERGFDVTGSEINPDILARLQNGDPHFHEQGLKLRMQRMLERGSLRFVRELDAYDGQKLFDVFIITVGTPLGADGVPRMDMVQNAARQVAAVMHDDAMVILRSTVQLGTSRNVVMPILKETGRPFQQAYCPERTIEGKALQELTTLPQIVGGGDNEATWRATQLFQHLTPTTIRVSSLETAEVIKLLDNSYRDLFFSFGNEVALLCDSAGLDGMEVIQAANSGYERTNIAMPGMVGGPCLEKDPHILRYSLSKYDFHPRLIASGRALNEELPSHIIDMIIRDMPGVEDNKDLIVSVCGIAFKGRPETDDTRGTPSKYLIDALKERFPHAKIQGQDFACSDEQIAEFGVEPVDIDQAFAGAHLVLIANNNARYQWLELDKHLQSMARPGLVFDCWSCLEVGKNEAPEGVRYVRLGSAAAWRQQAEASS